jgi:hypothetical protein
MYFKHSDIPMVRIGAGLHRFFVSVAVCGSSLSANRGAGTELMQAFACNY